MPTIDCLGFSPKNANPDETITLSAEYRVINTGINPYELLVVLRAGGVRINSKRVNVNGDSQFRDTISQELSVAELLEASGSAGGSLSVKVNIEESTVAGD